MSEEVTTPDEIDNEEVDSAYKPPPEKTLEEIIKADEDDESLRKYKEALLGEAQAGGVIVGKLCQILRIVNNRKSGRKICTMSNNSVCRDW